MTPDRSASDNMEYYNHKNDSIQKAHGSLESKIRELIEKNSQLKSQLVKQSRALNKFKDASQTIKQLQTQIAQLQS